MSIFLHAGLIACLPVCLDIFLSVHPFIHPSIFSCMSYLLLVHRLTILNFHRFLTGARVRYRKSLARLYIFTYDQITVWLANANFTSNIVFLECAFKHNMYNFSVTFVHVIFVTIVIYFANFLGFF